MGVSVFHIKREKNITVTFVCTLTAFPRSTSFRGGALWEKGPPSREAWFWVRSKVKTKGGDGLLESSFISDSGPPDILVQEARENADGAPNLGCRSRIVQKCLSTQKGHTAPALSLQVTVP